MPQVETPRREAQPARAEGRVVLNGVSWSTYEKLLADLVDRSVPRMTYDQGVLELMTPSPEHESVNGILVLLITIAADEWQMDVLDLGSTTFLREDQERGLEPDTCFYIQHEAAVRGKDRLDLSVDPPPDLAIEIDITRSAIPKLPVSVALGVPEVWRYDGERIWILVLEGQSYNQRPWSLAFPKLSDEVLTDWLSRGRRMARTAFLKDLRAWLRSTDGA